MKIKNTIYSAIFTITLGFSSTVTLAGNAPTAPEASPEVYKTIAENAQWRVMEATWQPGQEDNFHSHTADRVSIFKTNCKLRLSKPNGKFKDVKPRAGKAKARTGKPVKAHKATNTGNNVCKIVIVELK